ncbi:MAG: hypothetical protein GY940_08035, partial [bacterium]|nr:hypothetical protein [bacterium]
DLKSDKIKLTWKEFQRLLKQSGNRVDMNFDIADGIVTIKRERFRQILNRMAPPVGLNPVTPPKDHLVTEAKYSGTAGKNICRFTVQFKVFVFERDTLRYVRIPLLSARNAVSDITVNGAPGSMNVHGSWYAINLKDSGYHDVRATFSVARNKQAVSFPIIRSMINAVDFTVPFKGFEIEI